jgi:hypothetical protein
VKQVSLVTGIAGSGKTKWLIERVNDYAPELIDSEYKNVLAITRMHGSRRRVEARLREFCPSIRCSISTIDGFALSIVNRWRTSLGYSSPINAVSHESDFEKTLFGIDASFSKIVEAATSLILNETVKRIVGESYPLIVIDEFQDCQGHLLEFVKQLSECSKLLLAADEFQLLDTGGTDCPGVDWIRSLQASNQADIRDLPKCERTTAEGILKAAQCLRHELKSDQVTIPVLCCPNEGPAAWKIIDALVFGYYSARWSGTTALICPSNDPFIEKVLRSCTRQLKNKDRDPIKWHIELATDEEQRRIRAKLGLAEETSNDDWEPPANSLGPIETEIVARSERFAHLKGLTSMSTSLVSRQVDLVVHQRRAYGGHRSSRSVMTVHGAKNREFDNDFVLWGYKLPPNKVQQRKLLYNAITRAVKNCVVLVLGDVKRAADDPILSLLGPAQFAVPQKAKAKHAKKQSGAEQRDRRSRR